MKVNRIKTDIEQALEQYRNQFGMNFPIMSMRGTPEAEIVNLINQFLKDGVPYNLPQSDLNIFY